MNEDSNNDFSDGLGAALRQAFDALPEAPPFDEAFAAALRRHRQSRRRRGWFAAAAAVVVVVVVVVGMPTKESKYIDVQDLMATTQWIAPSDVLLPTHEFDIYQELPELLESTKPAEGALL